ncbi:NAD(P)H-dependent oxidoreductase [Notoacmeibacter sp. MSK16QG-6]|uniref:NADPH-dependent FMN reductase n=1 Tax=Notoacmeibacter sp. MSK16QG-6 TaxID=2957982 RepID=UPI0020A0E069|nr:NAD(P)H-dependent oxidoreductase [Notoacmeibacter sp. MSK16QG-6]
MNSKPRIAIIIGSTRKSRFAEKPAAWMLEKAKAHGAFDVELVDLADFDLPFFDEPASNRWMPSSDPKAVAWQEKIGTFDGYIFVVAEYNHSITGALKNALDQAWVEWNRKPMAYIAYGGAGGARAVEHLRAIGVELEMVPTRNAVHIAAGSFMAVHPMGQDGPMEGIEEAIAPAASAMLDELEWWAKATMTARQEQKAAA